MSKKKAPSRGLWFASYPPEWAVSRLPREIPKAIGDALFPYWDSKNAVKLRQIALFAGDGLEWFLASADINPRVFAEMAYGVRDSSEESPGWTADMAARINAESRALMKRRREIVEEDRRVSDYWQKLERNAGVDAELPPEIVSLHGRRGAEQ